MTVNFPMVDFDRSLRSRDDTTVGCLVIAISRVGATRPSLSMLKRVKKKCLICVSDFSVMEQVTKPHVRCTCS